jgi:hypothetical protein
LVKHLIRPSGSLNQTELSEIALAKTTKEVAMLGRREPSGEEIARRAHELYLQRGGEHGKDVEDWVRAEKELSDEPVAGPPKTKAAQAVRTASN